MKITWFGHDSFMIETAGKVIYTDPYVLPKGAKLADLVLVTHEHYDHCSPEKIREVTSKKTQVLMSPACRGKVTGNVRIVKEWDSVNFGGGIKINVVPAYNINKSFHPRGSGVGYTIESEGKSVYHTGDTDLIPEMERVGRIDVLLVPIGSKAYMMSTEDAVKVVQIIHPKIAVPMHYNYLEMIKADPQEFKQKVESATKTKVEILEGKVLEI